MPRINPETLTQQYPYLKYVEGSTLERHEELDVRTHRGFFFPSDLKYQVKIATAFQLDEYKIFCEKHTSGSAATKQKVQYRQDKTEKSSEEKNHSSDSSPNQAEHDRQYKMYHGTENFKRYQAGQELKAKYEEAIKQPLNCLERYNDHPAFGKLIDRTHALNLMKKHQRDSAGNAQYDSNYNRMKYFEHIGIRALCLSMEITPPLSLSSEDQATWPGQLSVQEIISKITTTDEQGKEHLLTPATDEQKTVYYAALSLLKKTADHLNSIRSAKLLAEIYIRSTDMPEEENIASHVNTEALPIVDKSNKTKNTLDSSWEKTLIHKQQYTQKEITAQKNKIKDNNASVRVLKCLKYYAADVTNTNHALRIINDASDLIEYFKQGGSAYYESLIEQKNNEISELTAWLEANPITETTDAETINSKKSYTQKKEDTLKERNDLQKKQTFYSTLITSTEEAIGAAPISTFRISIQELTAYESAIARGDSVDQHRIRVLQAKILKTLYPNLSIIIDHDFSEIEKATKVSDEEEKETSALKMSDEFTYYSAVKEGLESNFDQYKEWLGQQADALMENFDRNFTADLEIYRRGFIEHLGGDDYKQLQQGSIYSVTHREIEETTGTILTKKSVRPRMLKDIDPETATKLSKRYAGKGYEDIACPRSLTNIPLWEQLTKIDDPLQLVACIEKHLQIQQATADHKSLKTISDTFIEQLDQAEGQRLSVPALTKEDIDANPAIAEYAELRRLQLEIINARLGQLLNETYHKQNDTSTKTAYSFAATVPLSTLNKQFKETNAIVSQYEHSIATYKGSDAYQQDKKEKKSTEYKKYKKIKETLLPQAKNDLEKCRYLSGLAAKMHEIIDLLNWKVTILIQTLIKDFNHYGKLVDPNWIALIQQELWLNKKLIADFRANFSDTDFLHPNSTLTSVTKSFEQATKGNQKALSDNALLSVLNRAIFNADGTTHTQVSAFQGNLSSATTLHVAPSALATHTLWDCTQNDINRLTASYSSLLDEHKHSAAIVVTGLTESVSGKYTATSDDSYQENMRASHFYQTLGLSEASPDERLILTMVLLNQEMYPDQITFNRAAQRLAFRQVAQTITSIEKPITKSELRHQYNWAAAISLDPEALRYVAKNLRDYRLPEDYTEQVAGALESRQSIKLEALLNKLASNLEIMDGELSVKSQSASRLIGATRAAIMEIATLYTALYQIGHYGNHRDHLPQTGFTLDLRDLKRLLLMCNYNFSKVETQFAKVQKHTEQNWERVKSEFNNHSQKTNKKTRVAPPPLSQAHIDDDTKESGHIEELRVSDITLPQELQEPESESGTNSDSDEESKYSDTNSEDSQSTHGSDMDESDAENSSTDDDNVHDYLDEVNEEDGKDKLNAGEEQTNPPPAFNLAEIIAKQRTIINDNEPPEEKSDTQVDEQQYEHEEQITDETNADHRPAINLAAIITKQSDILKQPPTTGEEEQERLSNTSSHS